MRRVRMRPKRRAAAASADAEPSASPKASARPRRALVREVAGATGAIDALSSRLGMVVLALGCGFAVGVVVSLLLRATTAVTDLVWKGAASLFPVPWFALLACTVGGLVIGLWTWWSAERVHSLEEVMGEFRRTGSFRTRGLLRPTVSFLLPLAFGGSVGFEAGLTGIITSACCWVRDRLKAAGLRVAVVADVTIAACVSAIFGTPLAGIVCGVEGGHAAPDPDGALPAEADSAVDDFELARGAKVVLYAAAAVGALGGLVATGAVLGPSGGLPRFEAIGAHGVELAWVVPCIALGWLLSIVHHASARLFSRAAKALAPSGERSLASVVLPPVACGIVLGAVACALPYVLFPGEVQSEELMASWAAMGAPVLIATGLAKAAATPMCLSMGWMGGSFFPSIFSGVAAGFGLAALTGCDPMLAVTVTTSAHLAGVTRKPVVTIAILALCFPVSGVLWSGLAAVVGSVLPVGAPRRGEGE